MGNRQKPRFALRSLAVVCGLAFLVVTALAGQTKRATASHSGRSPHTFMVQSNLVLVPTFVYNQARMAQAPKQELPCVRATVKAFYKLSSTEPYLPKDCDATDMRGLTVKDFKLFQDGARQKITKITTGGWWTVARDNLGWHMRSSLTPKGIWDSSNLSRLKLVPPGVNRELYVLAYAPSNQKPGCHRIRVEVDRAHALVYARRGYCVGQTPSDPLFGTSRGKALEKMLTSRKQGKIPLSLQAGAFRASKDESLVDICLAFPWNELYRSWNLSKWSLYARIAVMGVVRRQDGTVAARFSDLLFPPYWPTFVQGGAIYIAWQSATSRLVSLANPGAARRNIHAWDLFRLFIANGVTSPFSDVGPNYEVVKKLLSSSDPAWLPTRYETQVRLPPGEYTLNVVLSDAEKFGRAEAKLVIGRYGHQGLRMSSVILCKRLRDAAAAAKEDAQANFAPRYVPLVSKGIRFTPAGDTRFKKGQPLFAFFEVYDPLLAGRSHAPVQVDIGIAEQGTGKIASTFAPVNAAPYERRGSRTLRIARRVPFAQLPNGNYTLEVRASDSAGRTTAWRTARFKLQSAPGVK